MTVVQGKNKELPREAGRHNLLLLLDYFASSNYPYKASDIHFKNCLIENAQGVLSYHADTGPLQSGTHLTELTLENVRFTDLKQSSCPRANAEEPLTIKMKNVSVEFCQGSDCKELFVLGDQSNTTIEVS